MTRLESMRQKILRKQSVLPKEILEELVSCLKSEKRYTRDNAALALGNQFALSKEVLEELINCLKDKDPHVNVCGRDSK